MQIFKDLFKNKMAVMGALIPFLVQLLFLGTIIPAYNKVEKRLPELNIVIVNFDDDAGKTVVVNLKEKLPFKISESHNLDQAIKEMNGRKFSMVIYLPQDFTNNLINGNAKITYYINQAAPMFEKQSMETVVKELDAKLNEMMFIGRKDKIMNKMNNAFADFKIPDSVTKPIRTKLDKAFHILSYSSVNISIDKPNDGKSYIPVVAVVNEDNQTGQVIAENLEKNLPFQVIQNKNLKESLDDMNKGKSNMVIFIPKNFTESITKGSADIHYYINQSASMVVRQIMEVAGKEINNKLNDFAFNMKKKYAKEGIEKGLFNSRLPKDVSKKIAVNIGAALENLSYTSINAVIEKYNENSGYTPSVAIVNEDNETGLEIVSGVKQNMPFKIDKLQDFQDAVSKMNNGLYSMVIYIPAGFSDKLYNNNAVIRYSINQASPLDTKQIMEVAAKELTHKLNENIFNVKKQKILEKINTGFSGIELPPQTKSMLAENIKKTFDNLPYKSVQMDIEKINNAGNFARNIYPLFIFVSSYTGSLSMSLLLLFSYAILRKKYSRLKLFFCRQIVNIILACILPAVVVVLNIIFDINFAMDTTSSWFFFSLSYFAIFLFFQMLMDLIGVMPGFATSFILLPVQMTAMGIIIPRNIMPLFYKITGDFLPSIYFGSGLFSVFFSGVFPVNDVIILIIMCMVFIGISLLCNLFKKENLELPKKLESIMN